MAKSPAPGSDAGLSFVRHVARFLEPRPPGLLPAGTAGSATLGKPRPRIESRAATRPLDIVLVPGFVSHVERVWEEPRSRAVLTQLSQMARLILFDRRGVGLSDRVGAPPTVEATADDLTTVMDAVGSRRVLLIGASEGGPCCIHSPPGI